MADSYLFDNSVMSERENFPFISKEVLYIMDQQQGSYTSSITFDSTQTSSNGKFLDYANSYLEIPYQITAGLTAGTTTPYSCGLKSAVHVIDSMSVDFGNRNVVNLTSFLNVFANFKMLTTWSQSDLLKWGDQLLFSPDSCSSVYKASASSQGIGICNNSIAFIGANREYKAAEPLDIINSGFLQRLKNTAFTVGTGDLLNIPSSSASALGRSAYSISGLLSTWNMLLTIRLKDICDFFSHLPLLQGAQIRLTINFNSCTHVIPQTQAVASATFGNTSITMNSGRTNPMQWAGASTSATGSPQALVGTGPITLASNVFKTAAGAAWGAVSSCRWYVPAYVLSPESVALYRSNEVAEINYHDLFYFPINNLTSGASFNQLITNGITSPAYMVVFPTMSAGQAYTGGANSPAPYQSSYDSVPNTTSPNMALQQFNVLVQGSVLFPQNEIYDHEQFINEISQINALNGGLSTGLNSGLISQFMWSNNYRYYVANLSRRVNQGETVSVQVQGIVPSCATDLMVFIVMNKTININKLTGNPVDA